MKTILFLIPLALFLGLCALAAFLWSLRSGQYDDLEGAGMRILIDDEDKPIANDNQNKEEAKQPATKQQAEISKD